MFSLRCRSNIECEEREGESGKGAVAVCIERGWCVMGVGLNAQFSYGFSLGVRVEIER